MWIIHKSNIHQPMRIYGQKLPYIWNQVHITNSCINMGSTNSKPKIDISLLNLSPRPSPLPTNLIHYLISNPCKISIIWYWLNPTNLCLQSNSSIIFQTKFSLKASFPCQTPSIPENVISWGGMPVKECILSVISCVSLLILKWYSSIN